ncbi:hypothetical protein, partial [Klebsiella pneumoniae]|uniref:hypothetical protein n=1 Tax=Klebsiella pneumoniae TaxID=573 RepID=UPI003EE0713D
STRRLLAARRSPPAAISLQVLVQDAHSRSWTFVLPVTVVPPRLTAPVIALSINDAGTYGNGDSGGDNGRPALSRDG